LRTSTSLFRRGSRQVSSKIFPVSVEGPTLTLSTGYLSPLSLATITSTSSNTLVNNHICRDAKSTSPLTINYVNRHAANGRIPGAVTRRDFARSDDNEILAARVVDRCVRPATSTLGKGVEVTCTVQAVDAGSDGITLAVNGVSAGLWSQGIISRGVGCVEVGLNADGTLCSGKGDSETFMTVGGGNGKVTMIEFGGSEPIAEDKVKEMLTMAVDALEPAIETQRALLDKVPSTTSISDPPSPPLPLTPELIAFGRSVYRGEKGENKATRGKREAEYRALLAEKLGLSEEEASDEDNETLYKALKISLKDAVFDGQRADGRGTDELRDLLACAPALPDVVHGSAVFGRGETQVLSTVTLGPPHDAIRIRDPYKHSRISSKYAVDIEANGYPVGSLRSIGPKESEDMMDLKKWEAEQMLVGQGGAFDKEEYKRSFLHYDFPSYSVGEVDGRTGPNRRSVGHGNLAEKAILPILPSASEFPYVVRMTSEVTSSNGSSSMATVCGTMLALMDAGVPVKEEVAGISVGLVEKDGEFLPLLDIIGTEDHYGEMDFKIAGTREKITAIQLDCKLKEGVPLDVLLGAMDLAKTGRNQIIDTMKAELDGPRNDVKSSAPRVEVVRFDPARKKDLVGPGGIVMTQIETHYGVVLDLSQEGQCLIYGEGGEHSYESGRGVKEARNAVNELVGDVEVGGIYEGVILDVKDFGATVEILRNKEAILHVSELTDDPEALKHPEGNKGVAESLLAIGMKIDLLCTEVDKVRGHIKMSRKQLARLRSSGKMWMENDSEEEEAVHVEDVEDAEDDNGEEEEEEDEETDGDGDGDGDEENDEEEDEEQNEKEDGKVNTASTADTTVYIDHEMIRAREWAIANIDQSTLKKETKDFQVPESKLDSSKTQHGYNDDNSRKAGKKGPDKKGGDKKGDGKRRKRRAKGRKRGGSK